MAKSSKPRALTRAEQQLIASALRNRAADKDRCAERLEEPDAAKTLRGVARLMRTDAAKLVELADVIEAAELVDCWPW